MKTKMPKRKKARKGGMKDVGALNAAKRGTVVKSKRGGPKAAKKKVVKKK